jgi:DNA-binding response OmpR family regulator
MMKVDGPFQGKRILVIEDEYLVAQVVIDYLEDAGAEVVGPFGRIDDALAYIDDHYSTLDAAVLDGNLHGQKSYPIADALGSKNIILIFTTGETLDSRFLHLPRCQKPFTQQALITAPAEVAKLHGCKRNLR